MKRILMVLMMILGLIAFFAPIHPALGQEQKTEKEWLEQLAKDLEELAEIILEANKILEQMSPEEQKEFIKKIVEEIIKLQRENPDIRIKILPSK